MKKLISILIIGSAILLMSFKNQSESNYIIEQNLPINCYAQAWDYTNRWMGVFGLDEGEDALTMSQQVGLMYYYYDLCEAGN